MKKFYLFSILVLTALHAYAQNKDTANISITNYKLFPGTYSWRGDNNYHDMTTWESSPYLQGHLKQGTQFKLNYRLLTPQSYNAQYSPGYPLIIMFHGAGERGNCWTDNCYCPDPAQCNPNDSPIEGTDSKFLNNDHQLAHGGLPHLNARNLAGSKLPDNPTLAARAFPGFVVFPQMTNQWRNQGSPANSDVSHAVRIVRLLCKQYNIDQNRIYIHGLSMGGQGMLEALNYADWLFAAAAPMSPINFQQNLEYDSVKNIPFWIFQGGKDLNPKPSQTEGMITNLRAKGANVRYTLYPHLGHGTWNTAYAEPDFFSWLLSFNKANIHVDFNNPNICETTSVGAKLNLPQGFPAYQWEFNGQLIASATSNTHIANAPGIYRARFSRTSQNPTEAEWNRWSDPVTVGKKSPGAPDVEQIGTLVLSDLNGSNIAQLQVPDDYVKYTWFQNDQTPAKVLVQDPNNPGLFTHTGCTGGGACPHSGAYTLVTEGFDRCPSLPSKPKYIVFGTHNTTVVPPTITGTPNNFAYEIKSPTAILLKWKDNSQNERGFEIWRRKLQNVAGEDFTEGWVLVTLTAEDVTLFVDKGVEPNSTYYYKIRAINNTGRSHYFPNNSPGNANHNLIVATPSETVAPTPPMNLVAKTTGFNSIELSWSPGTDNSAIKQYHIYYGGETIATGSADTAYVLTNLASNTVYNFTAKSEDPAGNLSVESNPAHAHTFVAGLYYKHSTGAWNNISEMASTWVNPEYTGWVSSFTLQPRTQEDYFNFEFAGFLYITTPGNYTFRLTSDDGSQLFLNNALIVDHDGLHGNTTKTGTAQSLDAGPIPIMVRYFEATGGQSLTVQYSGPDTNNSWVTVSASVLKSGNAPVPPVPPAAPTNMTAAASGQQSVGLAWNHPEALSFEIQRGVSDTGPFTTISKTTAKTFSDNPLLPGRVYFYRVRAVSSDTVSQFSDIASAQTLPDAESPTQPGTPVFHQQSFSTVSFTWTSSTDNIGVAVYEIYANSVIIGSSDTNGFQVTGLNADENYTFTIVAVDHNGNKSMPSIGKTMLAQSGITFFTQAGGSTLNDVNSWRSNGGAIPPDFNHSGQTFVILHQLPLTANWSVEGTNSRIVVSSGVTVNLDHAVTGTIDVQGTGILNLAHQILPSLGSLSAASTVNFLANASTSVPAGVYGNIGLSGASEYVFPEGELHVKGNITIADGARLIGASPNATSLQIGGNLSINGVLGSVDASAMIDLAMIKSGPQVITTSGDLAFYHLAKSGTSTLTINSAAPIAIQVGSARGGGLSISNGSEIALANNALAVVGEGAINGDGETGTIAINNGDLAFASSQNSNLYFSPANNIVNQFTLNNSNNSVVDVKSSVAISDLIQISGGKLNANGNVTLLSTNVKSASIGEITNGEIAGIVHVEKYIGATPGSYQGLSSPVDGVKISDWQNYFTITGPFPGASTGTGLGAESSVFISASNNLTGYPLSTNTAPFNNNAAPIERGKGYSALIRNTSAFVLTQSGIPFQGTVEIPLESPGSSAPDDGWNLVGNPYASAVVWSVDPAQWERQFVSSVISTRKHQSPSITQFEYFDAMTGLSIGETFAGGAIPSGHAFWVQTTNEGIPVLKIKEKAKSPESQPLPPISHIKLALTQNAMTDSAIIAITSQGSDDFDAAFDAVKRLNDGMFNFSTITTDGHAVAINNVNDDFCSKEVRLNLEDVSPGTYTLSVETLTTLAGIEVVKVIDHFTNSSIVLTENSEYTFTITSDGATFGNSRLSLILERSALDLSPLASASTQCGVPPQVTLINTQAGAAYVVVDENVIEVSAPVVSVGEDIVFTLDTSKLRDGDNTLNIKAYFDGCTSELLPDAMTIEFYHSVTLAITDMIVCTGESAEIDAQGGNTVASYEWKKDDQTLSETSSTLVTEPISEESFYSVRAITKDGCSGAETFISVIPITLNKPEITQDGETLFANSVGDSYDWRRNGVTVDLSASDSFTPEIPGSYTVSVIKGNCSKVSDEFIWTSVSDENSHKFSCRVFPNPASAGVMQLSISSRDKGQLRVRVIDMLGRVLIDRSYRNDAWQNGLTIMDNRLTSGVFIVWVEQKTERRMIKLIAE